MIRLAFIVLPLAIWAAAEIIRERRIERESYEQRLRRWNRDGFPPEDGIWFI